MVVDRTEHEYTFTVYTGTRNRAHTLSRPYDSLRTQTFRDFEWLIIDNDSTDGTEELVAGWQADADFPIRYIRHANRGHHGSSNRGVEEARGRFFVTLDSDDGAVPEALERFLAIWEDIPDDRRHRYAGVTALCREPDGTPISDPFPTSPFDSNVSEVRYRYRIMGERWGMLRRDVMLAHPYPTIPGYVGMMSSHLVWGTIGRTYTTRYVNEYLGIVDLAPTGTLTKGNPRDPRRDAIGEMLEARAIIDHQLRYFRYAPRDFYLKAAKYVRSAMWADVSFVSQVRELERPAAGLLWLAALPVGIAVYGAERLGLGRFIPGRDRRGVLR
jgi:glycosyltransferase involved in cell wall biosynthesis